MEIDKWYRGENIFKGLNFLRRCFVNVCPVDTPGTVQHHFADDKLLYHAYASILWMNFSTYFRITVVYLTSGPIWFHEKSTLRVILCYYFSHNVLINMYLISLENVLILQDYIPCRNLTRPQTIFTRCSDKYVFNFT